MQPKGVTESVTSVLREEIVTGKLPAGSKLNEIELSNRLGVSRPPLRESLRRLENEKLVVSIPRRGCFVSEMSIQDCIQIYQARLMLECTAIDILCDGRKVACTPILRSLETSASRISQWSDGDPPIIDFFYAMSDLHLKLVELSENKWLIHCYQSLRASLARYQFMFLNIPGSWKAAIEEHRRILVLLEKQCSQAKPELTRHLKGTQSLLIRRMREAQVPCRNKEKTNVQPETCKHKGGSK